jgi:site-specific recombinase XerD
MSGVDLPTVQKLLGHKSITTTMRYAHLAPEHLKSAVERLELGHYMDTRAYLEQKSS